MKTIVKVAIAAAAVALAAKVVKDILKADAEENVKEVIEPQQDNETGEQ